MAAIYHSGAFNFSKWAVFGKIMEPVLDNAAFKKHSNNASN